MLSEQRSCLPVQSYAVMGKGHKNEFGVLPVVQMALLTEKQIRIIMHFIADTATNENDFRINSP